ncbi:hypothetical protein FGIG_04439 [Fasciola gigantica]|uniref:Uncharacterized protein n=1 Tax=Fasciola gigantica TaxID=46835 RepID=A0A504Z0K2_FASGI|nr:hypothetical protein FGIG_04439 [Fasciola gigantica]
MCFKYLRTTVLDMEANISKKKVICSPNSKQAIIHFRDGEAVTWSEIEQVRGESEPNETSEIYQDEEQSPWKQNRLRKTAHRAYDLVNSCGEALANVFGITE